jgi:hypothetical protein
MVDFDDKEHQVRFIGLDVHRDCWTSQSLGMATSAVPDVSRPRPSSCRCSRRAWDRTIASRWRRPAAARSLAAKPSSGDRPPHATSGPIGGWNCNMQLVHAFAAAGSAILEIVTPARASARAGDAKVTAIRVGSLSNIAVAG